ncbi:hypothetical protein I7I51_03903 [Histoplasma capsulatum]|uniref:Uncharacterized protein n=1 Tax=Ajellomyces capsulatus TaxID=5037 RepID=A0A8A1M5F6_AJECA|nr:hypothetical protein I7I51_03903 [Histoplasma capsulatum]
MAWQCGVLAKGLGHSTSLIEWCCVSENEGLSIADDGSRKCKSRWPRTGPQPPNDNWSALEASTDQTYGQCYRPDKLRHGLDAWTDVRQTADIGKQPTRVAIQ